MVTNPMSAMACSVAAPTAMSPMPTQTAVFHVLHDGSFTASSVRIRRCRSGGAVRSGVAS
jgi:hypothetical protein